MDVSLRRHTDLLAERYPALKDCVPDVIRAYDVLETCFSSGRKLLIAGNGGSCADAEHLVGELMKGFKRKRKCPETFAEKLKAVDGVRGALLAGKLQGGLPAIALNSHPGLHSAFINDVSDGGLLTYAQQTYGYGGEGDVFLGVSTSGNAQNVMNAAVVARALGMKVVALTGETGGELAKFADVAVKAPASETYMVQELHLPIYHCLCLMLEERFFPED